MITIEELLRPDPELRRFAAKPEMDPLTEEGALQEAQLLDVRFDALPINGWPVVRASLGAAVA